MLIDATQYAVRSMDTCKVKLTTLITIDGLFKAYYMRINKR